MEKRVTKLYVEGKIKDWQNLRCRFNTITPNSKGQLIRKARHGDIDVLKKKKIITYCSSVYRGNIAADELNKQGFDAVTLEGGYSAWKDYGIKK